MRNCRRRCRRLRFRPVFLGHADTGAQRVASLFKRYRLGEHEACTQTESIRHAGFSFDDGDGDRVFVETGRACAVEHLCRVLRVVAIDDQQIETLRRQTLESKRRFAGMFKRDFEFVQNLGNRVNRFFIAAKQESPCSHNSFDGKKVVTCEQVTVVSDLKAGIRRQVLGVRPLVLGFPVDRPRTRVTSLLTLQATDTEN